MPGRAWALPSLKQPCSDSRVPCSLSDGVGRVLGVALTEKSAPRWSRASSRGGTGLIGVLYLGWGHPRSSSVSHLASSQSWGLFPSTNLKLPFRVRLSLSSGP